MIARMSDRAANLQPGDPLDPACTMGAMADVADTDSVMQMIDSGRKQVRLVCGGDRVSLNGSDAFVQRTIFIHCPADARSVRDEIFGPPLTIQTFKTDDQVLAIANDSN